MWSGKKNKAGTNVQFVGSGGAKNRGRRGLAAAGKWKGGYFADSVSDDAYSVEDLDDKASGADNKADDDGCVAHEQQKPVCAC